MSRLIKKITRGGTRASGRRSSEPIPPPKRPPSPSLAHLTPEEISILNNVFRRQEEFEKQEEDRVKRLERDLRHLEGLVRQQSSKGARLKPVDLRLCRLCYMTKFADGIGRICHDCSRRVCNKCGSFTKLKWDPKKNRNVKGRWRCALCQKRREYACVTGDWYHGREAKPSLNNSVFQRKLNDIWSGAESDWGNMSAPDGYDYVQRYARTDTELLPADRSDSPRGFRRAHRRRTYSEDSHRCAEEEEEVELDGELFWLERQKCRRERLEMQKRSARRRSSTCVNKLDEESPVSGETVPQRKNSSASYSYEKRPRRQSRSDTISYVSPDCGPYGGESTAESGQEFCKVHGYRSHADLPMENRLVKGKSMSHGKVRRSSSDGEYLDQPSHAHITRFLRDEALESHSSDSVAVLAKDLSAEGLLNPHLSSFRKDALSSEDVQCGKPTQTTYSSSYGSTSSVFAEDNSGRSRSGTGESRRTPQSHRGYPMRNPRSVEKVPPDTYANPPQMTWKGDRRDTYERWQSHESSLKGDNHPGRDRADPGRRPPSAMDNPETWRKEGPECNRRPSLSDSLKSQRHAGTKEPVEIIVRRPSDIVDADTMTQRMAVLEAMESDRRRSCPTDYSEKGRRYPGVLEPSERPYRRRSAGTDGSVRRPSGLIENSMVIKASRSQPTTRGSWERLNRRQVGSCERLNRQHTALRDSSERLNRRTSSQADVGDPLTFARQRSDSDTTDPERRMSGSKDKRAHGDPLRKSSSLGSEDSANPQQENQRRHSYDPPRRPSVISVERKHSDLYRRFPTSAERRSSVERLQRSSPSSRDLYEGNRRPSGDRRDSRDSRESIISRRESRDQGRRQSREVSHNPVGHRHSSSPGRGDPSDRRRSSASERSGGLSRSRESMSSDRESPRDSPHSYSSRREDNDKMRRISRRSSFSPFKVTFTVDQKEDGSCRTSSLGLRVVGGKRGVDGKLGAFVTYVSKGGAADKAGLRAGDQVLEWNGQRLVDATFEEAKRITDRSGCTVTITALRSRVQKPNELEREDSISIPHWHRESDVRRNLDASRDPSGSRQLRRSLPRIPVEVVNKSSRLVAGRISLKLSVDWRASKLHVTVLRAQGLLPREGPEKEMPQALVKLYLLPNRNMSQHYRTDVATGGGDPEWNTTYVFDDMTEEELCHRSLEVTVWDSFPHKPSLFLGEVLLDLNSANLDNVFSWYPLSDHDENSAPLPSGSPKPRPRSSAPSILEKDVGHLAGGAAEERSPWASLPLLPATPAHDKVKELLHKRNLPSQKSLEGDSPGTADTSEPVAAARDTKSNKLKKQSNKKKSSSQSSLSTTDEETKCRRESFRSKVRRRMSDVVTRVGAKLADRRSLSEDEAFRRDYDSRSQGKSCRSHNNLADRYKTNNVANSTSYSPTAALSSTSSVSMGTLMSSQNSDSTDLEDGFLMYPQGEESHEFDSVLGVGQVAPRPNMRTTVQGDVLLGFMITKGHLEVDVLGARELSLNHANQPPDTYVKTCLMEGTKKIQRKKTRTIKGSTEPRYGHKIKYSALNVQGRYMRVQVKGKCGGFERNQCLGEIVVKLDRLDLSKHTRGWYKLFQHSVTDFGSAESL